MAVKNVHRFIILPPLLKLLDSSSVQKSWDSVREKPEDHHPTPSRLDNSITTMSELKVSTMQQQQQQ